MAAAEQESKIKKAPHPSPSYLRIGKRYRPSRIDENYDALVVGSGPGGLASAVCLSKMGWKVAVLEQHYTAGGFTHVYGRNGYEWDVGVHYIGDMGSKKTLARSVFDFLSGGNLKWASMGKTYDRVFIDGDIFDFPAGKKELTDALCQKFPQEQQAIHRYFVLLDQAAKGMSTFAMSKVFPQWLTKLWFQRKLPEIMYTPTREVLQSLTTNQKLIATLTTQWGDAGLTPRDSSFFMHATIARHYLYGGYYPIGGASKIAETQLPAIQKSGGDVFTYARVAEILFEKNRASGVRMSDGHTISSPVVISAVGVPLTFGSLVPKSMGYDKKMEQVEPSMAHLCMYIGLKHTAEDLQLPKTNFWIYPNENHEANVDKFEQDMNQEFPLVYISFPSAKDPSWQERYPGTATIEIVAPAKYQWFEKWQDKTWGKRGDDYEQLKNQLAERLLEALYDKLPQVKGRIDYWELSSPLSTRYFNEYSQGEIYGLNHNPLRFRQNWLRPKTSLKGLYLSGQDTLTCGVVASAMSGIMTAVSVLGFWKARKLFALIKAGKSKD